MRRKKRILLAGSGPERVSVLKFTLEVNGYAVWTAQNFAEAAAVLDGGHCIELAICELPMAGADDIFARAWSEAFRPAIMAIAPAMAARPCHLPADIFIGKTDFSMATLLTQIKIATARKRGPRPMKKAVASALPAAAPQARIA